MSKIRSISGFPEWLPEEKLVEEEVVEKLKAICKSHGCVPIETPAVELLTTLIPEGTFNKEVYTIRRLSDEESDESSLGLHFDLTRPFARYAAQHYNELIFPFKRYQFQKVWRGERPQKGRFREFYQFDVDIVATENLPLACDAEVLTIFDKFFTAIEIGKHKIRVNNRKILLGFYESLGLDEGTRKSAVVSVDKIDKIGAEGVLKDLVDNVKVSGQITSRIVEFSKLRISVSGAKEKLLSLGIKNDLFNEGVEEISEVLELSSKSVQNNTEIDLSLARGLDYYTGMIFEITLPDYADFGSASGGGRYDDLASEFINKKLPGVGASIGLTRLMDLILRQKLIEPKRKTTTDLLVAVYVEDDRVKCNEIAETLRVAGAAVEVYPSSPKLGKQIDYAAAKGIRYVLFVSASDGGIEIKDLKTKEQTKVNDLSAWWRTLISN